MRATKESLTNLLTTFTKSESHEIKFYGYFYQKIYSVYKWKTS